MPEEHHTNKRRPDSELTLLNLVQEKVKKRREKKKRQSGSSRDMEKTGSPKTYLRRLPQRQVPGPSSTSQHDDSPSESSRSYTPRRTHPSPTVDSTSPVSSRSRVVEGSVTSDYASWGRSVDPKLLRDRYYGFPLPPRVSSFEDHGAVQHSGAYRLDLDTPAIKHRWDGKPSLRDRYMTPDSRRFEADASSSSPDAGNSSLASSSSSVPVEEKWSSPPSVMSSPIMSVMARRNAEKRGIPDRRAVVLATNDCLHSTPIRSLSLLRSASVGRRSMGSIGSQHGNAPVPESLQPYYPTPQNDSRYTTWLESQDHEKACGVTLTSERCLRHSRILGCGQFAPPSPQLAATKPDAYTKTLSPSSSVTSVRFGDLALGRNWREPPIESFMNDDYSDGGSQFDL